MIAGVDLARDWDPAALSLALIESRNRTLRWLSAFVSICAISGVTYLRPCDTVRTACTRSSPAASCRRW